MATNATKCRYDKWIKRLVKNFLGKIKIKKHMFLLEIKVEQDIDSLELGNF